MSGTIHIRAAAERDMDDLVDYIAERNPDAAVRVLDAIRATFEELLRFPRLGRLRDYHHPALKGMRMRPTLGYNNYLVFYLPTDDGIDIVRVLHASRNIEALFTESDQ